MEGQKYHLGGARNSLMKWVPNSLDLEEPFSKARLLFSFVKEKIISTFSSEGQCLSMVPLSYMPVTFRKEKVKNEGMLQLTLCSGGFVKPVARLVLQGCQNCPGGITWYIV